MVEVCCKDDETMRIMAMGSRPVRLRFPAYIAAASPARRGPNKPRPGKARADVPPPDPPQVNVNVQPGMH